MGKGNATQGTLPSAFLFSHARSDASSPCAVGERGYDCWARMDVSVFTKSEVSSPGPYWRSALLVWSRNPVVLSHSSFVRRSEFGSEREGPGTALMVPGAFIVWRV
jgi:hypothetical protein